MPIPVNPFAVGDPSGQRSFLACEITVTQSCAARQVHFFAEEGILEADGSLPAGIPRVDALNKVGHALHAELEAFRT